MRVSMMHVDASAVSNREETVILSCRAVVSIVNAENVGQQASFCVHVSAGCAHNMWKDGGVQGLFKGNMATMMKVAPQTAIQFAVSLMLQPSGPASHFQSLYLSD